MKADLHFNLVSGEFLRQPPALKKMGRDYLCLPKGACADPARCVEPLHLGQPGSFMCKEQKQCFLGSPVALISFFFFFFGTRLLFPLDLKFLPGKDQFLLLSFALFPVFPEPAYSGCSVIIG